ncbi:MAG: GTP pyrophosphokinase family protein [Coprococcus sp.]
MDALLYPEQNPFQAEMAKFEELMMMYNCAIKEVQTKLEVLNTDFSVRYKRNPIEFITSRLKRPASIAAKLKSRNIPISVKAIKDNLNDAAGIRVICSFLDDIYAVAERLVRQDDITLIDAKDYIIHPKPNGYRSLHLIIEIPVFFADHTRNMRVEVQIRTIAMDFWASLDHQLKYKQDLENPEEITAALKKCADTIAQTDLDMQSIKNSIYGEEKQPLKKFEDSL